MRICHVITRFVRGGADENTLLSCNAQARNGHSVWLVHGREWHPDIAAEIDPRVNRISIDSLQRDISPVHDTAALLSLVQRMLSIRPDVVHTHTSKAGILGRLAATIAGTKTVVHGVHIVPWLNVSPNVAKLYLGLERVMVPFTDAFIDVAAEIRDVCVDVGVGRDTSHHVIHSGMDTERFRDASRRIEWRTLLAPELITPTAPKFLVHVSALESRKRQSEFLDVFVHVARADEDAVLLFVGDGPQRSALERKIEKLGLDGRALCVGFQRNVEQWISIARACLLTSLREGLARVLVQYALVGRPIVATDIPGCRTIVTQGVNGYLVPAESLDAMIDPLRAILSDSTLAERLGAANHQIDLRPWSADTMAARIEDVYAVAIAGPRPRIWRPFEWFAAKSSTL